MLQPRVTRLRIPTETAAGTNVGVTAVRAELALLTCLRFVAASHVVLFHCMPHQSDGFWAAVLAGGPYSVTFFFILSGFVLGYAYSGDTPAAPARSGACKFWRARLARILPAYWLALLIGFPGLAYATFFSGINSVEAFIWALVLVPTGLQSFVPTYANAWNAPAWSLSVEMVFYAFFPAVLGVVRVVRPRQLLWVGAAFVVGVAIVQEQFRPGVEATTAMWNFYKFFPAFHVPTFVLGLALGRFFLFGPKLSTIMSSIGGAASAICLIILLGFRLQAPSWLPVHLLILAAMSALILSAGRASEAIGNSIGRLAPMLGHASYGMYIYHMPLWFWWSWLVQKQVGTAVEPVQKLLGFFLLLVVFSIASLMWIEQPVRRWASRSILSTAQK